MPGMMMWAPEIPPEPHPSANKDSSLTFASRSNYQAPIDVRWAVSFVDI